MTYLLLATGATAALVSRTVFVRLLLAKLRRDVRQLNAGDHRPLLAAYAEDAVLHFDDGEHRWSGRHVGRGAIGRFLQLFVEAGLSGEIRAVWISGPPWALKLVARFDDKAVDPMVGQLYANRTMLLVRTRWGRIVEQEDFYLDTRRIDELERRLVALGRHPSALDQS